MGIIATGATENWTEQPTPVLERGAIVTAAGDGKVASAVHADDATAAVAVLTGEGHENKAYELTGDTAWSFAEYADELITYTPVSVEVYTGALTGAGLPEPVAAAFAGSDASPGVPRGACFRCALPTETGRRGSCCSPTPTG